ncbi:hypothetical protein KR054_007426, partial [Drosophila jambulina]
MTFEANSLGRTSKIKDAIDLVEGPVPVKDRHYPVSPAVESLIYEEVNEMLRLGVIEESDSAWSNTITLVRKPEKNRLCPDARKLNKITVPIHNRALKEADGGEGPIAFMSQKLNQCQRNYSVTEKECFAAVEAIKRFRPYIELMPFTVITDHASLKWLMSLKDLSGRLARWSLQLQAYDFCIGSENVVADTLSRMVESLEDTGDEWMLGFQTIELESDEYRELRDVVEAEKDQRPDLKVVDGFVFKRA